jgi:Helix-hairpin-helix motif
VHAIHDSPIGTEDDWVRGVDLLDEAHVLDHLANGGNLHASVEPVVRVNVTQGIERYFSDRESRTQTDQLVNVPSVQTHVTRPEVVLLAHDLKSYSNRPNGSLTDDVYCSWFGHWASCIGTSGHPLVRKFHHGPGGGMGTIVSETNMRSEMKPSPVDPGSPAAPDVRTPRGQHVEKQTRAFRFNPSRGRRLLSVIWAIIPALTLGWGAPFTFTYAALHLRSKALGWCSGAYGLAAFTSFYLLGGPDSDTNWQANLGTGIALMTMAVATAQAFAIRPRLLQGPTTQQMAIEDASSRVKLREQARRLVASDPHLAEELRIGRPDLPRQFDDGGLVDVNHASLATIAGLPGIDMSMANQIVLKREEIGGFDSVGDLCGFLSVAPQVFDRAVDLLIFRR